LIGTKLAMDLAGWVGAFTLLFAYAGVSFRRMAPNSFIYQGMNAFGSICLVLNTMYYRAYPSAFVNFVWIGIAIAAGMRVSKGAREY
jgi:hypothetical protein